MREEINLAGFIDHTLLKPEATAENIARLCTEARRYNFAAVCVNPVNVKTACEHLRGSGVRVSAVVGFPLGATTAAVKAFEAGEAVAGGADEIDMVIHVGALRSGATDCIHEEIAAVVKAARGRPVKVILETGLLTDDEKITACRVAKKAGAHFVKTSTGFGPGGATAADIRLMRDTVGPAMGIKASGGVRTREAALEMIAAGATRIGTSSGIAIIEG
jgi:deoxyribose-phosphate aldolase